MAGSHRILSIEKSYKQIVIADCQSDGGLSSCQDSVWGLDSHEIRNGFTVRSSVSGYES